MNASSTSRFPPSRTGPRIWLLRHLQTFFNTLGQLARAPVGTLMTAGVIGVALALPMGLYSVLDNVMTLTRSWDAGSRVSVFLQPDVDDAGARALARRVATHPAIEKVRVITRAEALAEYRRLSGFAEVLDAFGQDNPLPATLVVTVTGSSAAPGAVQGLVDDLQALPEVELAQFDLRWLRRLNSIVDLVRRGVGFLGGLLALGVVLIVGNTIRLGIDNRRAEIEIAKLFGATDAFVRRPFLYTGILYGLLGGALAWLLVHGVIELLRPPVAAVATLYLSAFRLSPLDFVDTAALLGGGAFLGLLGAWLTVGRHLRAIEPR